MPTLVFCPKNPVFLSGISAVFNDFFTLCWNAAAFKTPIAPIANLGNVGCCPRHPNRPNRPPLGIWGARHAAVSGTLIAQIPAAIGAIILVIPLLSGAWDEIKKGKPASDSLASLAVVAALSADMYLAAGFLALFLWMANLILSRTAWGAQRAIKDLVDPTPGSARLIDGSNVDMSIFGTSKHFKEQTIEKKENIYSNIDDMLGQSLKTDDE